MISFQMIKITPTQNTIGFIIGKNEKSAEAIKKLNPMIIIDRCLSGKFFKKIKRIE